MSFSSFSSHGVFSTAKRSEADKFKGGEKKTASRAEAPRWIPHISGVVGRPLTLWFLLSKEALGHFCEEFLGRTWRMELWHHHAAVRGELIWGEALKYITRKVKKTRGGGGRRATKTSAKCWRSKTSHAPWRTRGWGSDPGTVCRWGFFAGCPRWVSAQGGRWWTAGGTGLPLCTCTSPSGRGSQKAGCRTSACTWKNREEETPSAVWHFYLK